MSDTQLLRVTEAAERLGMKPATIRRWILCRKIRYTKIGDRAVRVFADDVERLILQGTVPPRAGAR